jgi:amino acid transporter
VVHPGNHVVFVRGARRVRGKLQHVRARGRVPRGEAVLGGTLAKFSVSALMFDYILTGPISGVSAGQYLGGLLSELTVYLHLGPSFTEVTISRIAATFAIVVTLYFWWENTKGVHESSEKALHIMKLVTVMVVVLIVWCVYTIVLRHSPLPPFSLSKEHPFDAGRSGLAGA